MKVLVTGAAGFIGGQLMHALWKNGHTAIGVDNYSYGSADNLHFDDHDFSADVIKMDIRDKEGMKALFEQEKFDIVYNIAGIAPLPDCQSDPVEAVSVNTLGLVNVLENARRTGVKHVIQASTNAMYENETEFPTVESKFNPPTLIYPNTKYCGERFCQSFADTYGMNITCLRFANVYGPHIDCLRRELYATACELMGKQIEAKYCPSSHYWAKYPELYGGAYGIKPEILDHEVNKYSLCDNTHAKECYGWEPKIDIREGLRRVIENECAMLAARDAKGE